MLNMQDVQIQVIGRAVVILEAMAKAGQPLSLKDISDAAKLTKSTTHNILSTLVAVGLAAQVPETKRYRLGIKVLSLGAAFLDSVEVRSVAKPHMTRLRDVTNETVSLHVRVGWKRTCIDQVASSQPVRRVLEIGGSLPLHLGNAGLVLLSDLTESEFGSYLEFLGADEPARLSSHEPNHIRVLVQQARQDGFSMDNPERVDAKVGSVAAAIRDHRGRVAAALVVSGPAERWGKAAIQGFLPEILACAKAISLQLGSG